ncbi:MAG: hypothetical protein ABH828_01425 [archaeon]
MGENESKDVVHQPVISIDELARNIEKHFKIKFVGVGNELVGESVIYYLNEVTDISVRRLRDYFNKDFIFEPEKTDYAISQFVEKLGKDELDVPAQGIISAEKFEETKKIEDLEKSTGLPVYKKDNTYTTKDIGNPIHHPDFGDGHIIAVNNKTSVVYIIFGDTKKTLEKKTLPMKREFKYVTNTMKPPKVEYL